MKSNVKLRSNVYVRLAVPVRDDPEYQAKVCGREALRMLLDKIEKFNTLDRARRWMTAVQLQEWNEVTRCAMCKTQVVGPVRSGQRVTIEFRCPHGVCPYQNRDNRR